MEVSLGFEALQNSIPYKWVTNSGFSAEDLVSDLIGFYRAVKPATEYLTECRPVSKESAYKVWDSFGAVGEKKNHSFGPLLYPCDECGKNGKDPITAPLPSFLSSIKPAKKGELFRNWTILDWYK